MDSLVVDSSVAIKWFVDELNSTEARRVLDRYENGSVTFCAPDLLNAEFGNILWKKQAFQGLSASDAQAILGQFRKLQFVFTPSADLIDDAYKLAVEHNRTVYDALYLALGVRENCRIVTADEKLVNATSKHFPNLMGIAEWP